MGLITSSRIDSPIIGITSFIFLSFVLPILTEMMLVDADKDWYLIFAMTCSGWKDTC